MTASDGATNFNWLIANFVRRTVGVDQTVVVSSDGLLVALGGALDRDSADRLAAVITGIRSLSHGASDTLARGPVAQVLVEMERGYLLVAAVSGGAAIGVVASRDCDLGLVGYEMALLVQRVGQQLTPALVSELKQSLVEA